MIKTAKELVAACLDAVNNFKTLYVMGCFGAPMTEKNKARYINGYAFNQKDERKAKIQAASADTFGFDCICFIKALFWGWTGDPEQVYGGAVYKGGGVPDISADQLLGQCIGVSEDFSTIVPGEYVWLPGHCGIYVGDGLAAEATFEPEEGVQLQCVLPMGVKEGMPATGWVKHGKLPWVSYETEPEEDSKIYKVVVYADGQTDAEEKRQQLIAAGYSAVIEVIEPEHTPEEKPDEPTPAPVEPAWEPDVGDLVQFKGGLQYGSANGTAGEERPAGLARITKTAPGKLHPWHLVKTGKTGPYGWVDRDTFIS